jgi:hypothetical protein
VKVLFAVNRVLPQQPCRRPSTDAFPGMNTNM